MLGDQHVHHQFTGFGAVVFRLDRAPILPLCDPLYCCPQFPYEKMAVIRLCPVILGILSTGGGEVLLTRPHRIFHQHTMPPCLPSIQPLLYPLPYCVVCGDMLGSLQYHHMEDNAPLRVPMSILHPKQLLVQRPDAA